MSADHDSVRQWANRVKNDFTYRAIAAAYLEHDAENAALRHDIARAVDTTSALATENEELRRQLKAADRNHLHASQERDAEREALEEAERRVATEQSQKEYLRGCLRDSQEISSSNRKRAESAEARLAAVEAENLRLRKIAAHVPAKDYIKAKEAAGYGAKLNALSATPKADSAKESERRHKPETPTGHLACPSHCCPVHGCKYGYDDCPIVTGKATPELQNNNGCESCEMEIVPADSANRFADAGKPMDEEAARLEAEIGRLCLHGLHYTGEGSPSFSRPIAELIGNLSAELSRRRDKAKSSPAS